MTDYVPVEISVRRDVAELLRDKQCADRLGRLVSEMLRPTSPASDPLAALIAAVKADARAGGLTDPEVEAGLDRNKEQYWLAENRPAMDAWNDYVEQHGLPLTESRQF